MAAGEAAARASGRREFGVGTRKRELCLLVARVISFAYVAGELIEETGRGSCRTYLKRHSAVLLQSLNIPTFRFMLSQIFLSLTTISLGIVYFKYGIYAVTFSE